MHVMANLRYRKLAFVIVGFGQKYPKDHLEGRVQSSVCGMRFRKEELRGIRSSLRCVLTVCTLASTPRVKEAVDVTEHGERLPLGWGYCLGTT